MKNHRYEPQPGYFLVPNCISPRFLVPKLNLGMTLSSTDVLCAMLIDRSRAIDISAQRRRVPEGNAKLSFVPFPVPKRSLANEGAGTTAAGHSSRWSVAGYRQYPPQIPPDSRLQTPDSTLTLLYSATKAGRLTRAGASHTIASDKRPQARRAVSGGPEDHIPGPEGSHTQARRASHPQARKASRPQARRAASSGPEGRTRIARRNAPGTGATRTSPARAE